jgi:hypothetical protein
MTFDLDGVICQPPFGVNVGISRNLSVPPLPAVIMPRRPHRAGLRRTLNVLMHTVRYLGRKPMPDAREGLLAIREHREVLLVTARSALILPLIEAWLRQHNLRDCFAAVFANDTTLRSAQFKLHKVRELGAGEHIDDDGATAYYLARHSLPRVYLRDWPRNRGLPYPANVEVVGSLMEIAERLARETDGG